MSPRKPAKGPPRMLPEHCAGSVGVDAFDEVLIGKWLHVERMSSRAWMCIVGGLHLTVSTRTDGTASVFVFDDNRPERERRKDANR